MTDLVERYVNQVGRYLPKKERAEIEEELRSQIHDQLDDRYAEAASEAEIAAVLTELGEPRRMAASYGGEQYLVGPDLYPYMMMILRHGWLFVPAIVVFVHIFEALISSQPNSLIGLFIGSLVASVQAALIFSAVVVLFFAILQHSGEKLYEKQKAFNPLELPEVNDPGAVDRFEASFGAAFGTFAILVFLYWLHVGGLTLRFDLSDPGEVIAVPPGWMLLLIIINFAMLAVHLLVLRRNQWNVALQLTQFLLELVGMICLYFVLYLPLTERILTAVPALNNLPFVGSLPEILVVLSAIITVTGEGSKLLRLWNHRSGSAPHLIIKTQG